MSGACRTPATNELCARLFRAGADTSLADRDGKTPLQLARSRGYAGIVQQLERAGAK